MTIAKYIPNKTEIFPKILVSFLIYSYLLQFIQPALCHCCTCLSWNVTTIKSSKNLISKQYFKVSSMFAFKFPCQIQVQKLLRKLLILLSNLFQFYFMLHLFLYLSPNLNILNRLEMCKSVHHNTLFFLRASIKTN